MVRLSGEIAQNNLGNLKFFSTYAKIGKITIYFNTRKTKNSYRNSVIYSRRLKLCKEVSGNLGVYLGVLIPYGWQKNGMGYVEVLIICIKMGWRVKTLHFLAQHTDRWKANSVLGLEKMITRVEANKVSQQDCTLWLNTENTLLHQIK